MILHHQQALQLAGIAGWEAKSAEVKKIAAAITVVQEPQKKQMSAWLTSWGKPVPAPSHGGHHAEESIPGMLDEDRNARRRYRPLRTGRNPETTAGTASGRLAQP
ncbi:hypothetical protein GCM10009789_38210 [Kribbella sancticallisti]|uniref:DUF305 domain-containing protein n=1 Tax=Kribbella sancticallisti TaxID=460087 RepID=A0ABP4PGP7_9ACTN